MLAVVYTLEYKIAFKVVLWVVVFSMNQYLDAYKLLWLDFQKRCNSQNGYQAFPTYQDFLKAVFITQIEFTAWLILIVKGKGALMMFYSVDVV